MHNYRPTSNFSGYERFNSWNENEYSNCSEICSCLYVDKIQKLEELAEGGNEVAKRYSKAYKTLSSLLDLLQLKNQTSLQNDQDLQTRILTDISSILTIDPKIPNWQPSLLHTVSTVAEIAFERHRSETLCTELDKCVRICHVYFTGVKSSFDALMLTISSLDKYPSEPFFYLIRGIMLLSMGKVDYAIQMQNSALEKFPTHFELLYTKASFLKEASTSTFEEQLEAWQNLLRQSSKSDRHVPEAHYEIGLLVFRECVLQENTSRAFTRALNTMKNALKSGEDAEQFILPCNLKCREHFLPLKTLLKNSIVKAELKMSQVKIECEVTKIKILGHRSLLYMLDPSQYLDISDNLYKLTISRGPPNQIHASESPKFIKYTSIEPALLSTPNSISLILQQGQFGKIFECHIFNFDASKFGQQGQDLQDLFGLGCTISLAYFPLSSVIRINIPCKDSLIFHEERRLNRPCNYCGVQNALMNCSQCKKAFYCDAFCQKRDWKEFGHKKFCLQIKKQYVDFLKRIIN